jgi:CRP-like cAMP-binding protein
VSEQVGNGSIEGNDGIGTGSGTTGGAAGTTGGATGGGPAGGPGQSGGAGQVSPVGPLGSSPLFAALDPEAQEALRHRMHDIKLGRGETLFSEGDPGDKLYVVTTGKVKLGRTAADGRENLLAVLGPGEMFGELSLFDPGPRTATATAVTATTLSGLGHEALDPLLNQRPEVAGRLLAALARRLRRTNEAMADLIFSDVPGRVAKALLDLAQRFGVETSDGLRVTHDLTQEELAQLVGASRETVNKALADFASRGFLRLDGRAVVILDLERLTRRAG